VMDKEDPNTMAATCPAEHGTIVNTSEDKQRCEENSKVVDTLEDIVTCVAGL
jgi:hypothetical protein